MIGSMQDVFKKVAESKPAEGGNRIADGDYLYLIEKFTVESKRTGICFIMDFRVLESKKTEPEVEPNAVGMTVSHVANVSKHESALGDVKAFVTAALGVDGDVSNEEMQATLEACAGGDQPLRGMKIANATYRRENQGKSNPANRGKIMTLNKYRHVPGQDEASIDEGRAYLDGSPTAPQQTVAAPPQAQPQAAAAPSGLLGRLKK